MNIKTLTLLSGGIALAAASCSGGRTANTGSKGTGSNGVRPNVIFIMCDDMGYGDLGCYGQPYIETPNIDRMAREGMRFTQAYAGAPVSAPSRASFMTGQHTGHTLVRGNKEYWAGSPKIMYGENEEYSVSGQMPYDPGHVIIPELMQENGYTVGMFGKWAGGYEGSESTPDKRGVDEFYGYICQYQAHLYYPNFLNRFSRSAGDTCVVREVLEENIQHPMFGDDYFSRSQYSADLIHRRALDWLDTQGGGKSPSGEAKPFFGIFTYTLPHAELAQPHDSIVIEYESRFTEDKSWGGSEGSRYNPVTHTHAQFAAMITRLDAYVGEILAKLEEKGLDKNTIVIFTSDNGPHEEGGADPKFFGRDGKLRGLKRQCYEGGIRVPFIARWPGHIEAGSENDHMFAFYDLMNTFCDLTGAEAPQSTEDDGISIAPTLLGKKGQKEHPYLYWEFSETDQVAVRMGDWKMISVKGEPRLYNLAEDIHEDNDIASEHPDIVKQMIEIANAEHTESEYFRVTMPKGNN